MCSGCSTSSAQDVPVLSAVRPNGEDTHRGVRGGRRRARAAEAARAAARYQRHDGHGPHAGREPRELRSSTTRKSSGRSIAPFSDKAPIVVLHGSLAPESAIVKLGVCAGRIARASFSGPRDRVRRRRPRRSTRIRRRDGESPATCSSSAAWARRAARAWRARRRWSCSRSTRAGLEHEVAFVTDGQLSRPVQQGPHGGRSVARGRRRRPAVRWSRTATGSRWMSTGSCWTLEVPETELGARRARRWAVPELPQCQRLSVDLSAQRAADVHRRRARRERLSYRARSAPTKIATCARSASARSPASIGWTRSEPMCRQLATPSASSRWPRSK